MCGLCLKPIFIILYRLYEHFIDRRYEKPLKPASMDLVWLHLPLPFMPVASVASWAVSAMDSLAPNEVVTLMYSQVQSACH